MQKTNPLLGGNNQVQIIIDKAVTVPLTYQYTNSSGLSVWSGNYTTSNTYANGNHSYVLQASQPYVQTDIATNFSSPTTESNNTGIESSGSYYISPSSASMLPTTQLSTYSTGSSSNSFVIPIVSQSPKPNQGSKNQNEKNKISSNSDYAIGIVSGLLVIIVISIIIKLKL
jgi:hypothetical protein